MPQLPLSDHRKRNTNTEQPNLPSALHPLQKRYLWKEDRQEVYFLYIYIYMKAGVGLDQKLEVDFNLEDLTVTR